MSLSVTEGLRAVGGLARKAWNKWRSSPFPLTESRLQEISDANVDSRLLVDTCRAAFLRQYTKTILGLTVLGFSTAALYDAPWGNVIWTKAASIYEFFSASSVYVPSILLLSAIPYLARNALGVAKGSLQGASGEDVIARTLYQLPPIPEYDKEAYEVDEDSCVHPDDMEHAKIALGARRALRQGAY